MIFFHLNNQESFFSMKTIFMLFSYSNLIVHVVNAFCQNAADLSTKCVASVIGITVFSVIAVIYVAAMLIWLWDSITLKSIERTPTKDLTIVEAGSKDFNDNWETTSSVTSSYSSSRHLRCRNRLFVVVNEEDEQ